MELIIGFLLIGFCIVILPYILTYVLFMLACLVVFIIFAIVVGGIKAMFSIE
jgi:hypothetical protein